MTATLDAAGFGALIQQLCEFIARFGLARGLAGPTIILIWQRVRTAGAQVESLLARLHAGALRRQLHRRRPAPRTAPRTATRPRPPRGPLPRKRGWLVALVPETAGNAAQLQHVLTNPDIPALLAAAPQLRRSLRPLCHMLGVSLPKSPPAPPAPPPASLPPKPPLPGGDPTPFATLAMAPASARGMASAPSTRSRPRARSRGHPGRQRHPNQRCPARATGAVRPRARFCCVFRKN